MLLFFLFSNLIFRHIDTYTVLISLFTIDEIVKYRRQNSNVGLFDRIKAAIKSCNVKEEEVDTLFKKLFITTQKE